MARTQKDVVDYFPHDANASTGDTLTVLQNRFGNDGYAFWFKLLEKLASTEGHYIDCRNPTKWQLFIAKMGVNEITTVEIMKLLVEMQAIDKDLWESKLIWCQELVDNVADVYKNRRREIPQKPVTTGGKAITTGGKAITTGESTQSKVKESKVNNSIYKKFEVFWKAYPKRKSKGQAEKAFVKVNPDEQLLATMLATIERAMKSEDWQKEGGKFIPYPATWLNAKGWEDEFPEKGGQSGTHRKGSQKLPPRNGYTKPRANPKLDKLVEQERTAGHSPGRDKPG
ncbi:hypothetical protein ES708_31763 [subsurface metagenome]